MPQTFFRLHFLFNMFINPIHDIITSQNENKTNNIIIIFNTKIIIMDYIYVKMVKSQKNYSIKKVIYLLLIY